MKSDAPLVMIVAVVIMGALAFYLGLRGCT